VSEGTKQIVPSVEDLQTLAIFVTELVLMRQKSVKIGHKMRTSMRDVENRTIAFRFFKRDDHLPISLPYISDKGKFSRLKQVGKKEKE
jgi:hypothetical protein